MYRHHSKVTAFDNQIWAAVSAKVYLSKSWMLETVLSHVQREQERAYRSYLEVVFTHRRASLPNAPWQCQLPQHTTTPHVRYLDPKSPLHADCVSRESPVASLPKTKQTRPSECIPVSGFDPRCVIPNADTPDFTSARSCPASAGVLKHARENTPP